MAISLSLSHWSRRPILRSDCPRKVFSLVYVKLTWLRKLGFRTWQIFARRKLGTHMRVRNIRRTEPESQILYRLKYRCEVDSELMRTQPWQDLFFVVELSPLGERKVSLDFEPQGARGAGEAASQLTEREQLAVLEILQGLAEGDQLPR